MRNYEVKTPVRGLPRADGLRAPVDAGEVVMLPMSFAGELLDMGSIEPSDAEVTFLLDWPEWMSIGKLSTPIAVVAVTDRYALVAAIEELGGIVFFVGEGLPDNAEGVLADFSNDQLLDEVAARIDEARLAPTLLGGLIDIAPPAEADAADADAASEGGDATTDKAETPVADAPPPGDKPGRKKAESK